MTSPQQTYTAEYMAAFDRTESFGLKAPRRVLVRKDCIDPTFALAAALKYFDSHSSFERTRMPVQTNADFLAIFWQEAQVPLELTFGVVDVGGKTYGECSDATIRRYLRDKDLAWQREGVPFRVWLTSPACEVLDVTFAMVTSQTREQCAKRIIYKPVSASHLSTPVYHPRIVGVDFLEQTGALFDPEVV